MALYIHKPYPRQHRRNYALNSVPRYYDEKPQLFFPIDVKSEDDQYVISALLPGVKAEDLDIQIVNETVTIKGEIFKKVEEEDVFLLQERPSGKFERSLNLPDPLDSEKTEAELKDGILTLRVPKSELAKPRVIKVNKR